MNENRKYTKADFEEDRLSITQVKGSVSCRFSVSNAEMQDLTPARFRASSCTVAVESQVRYAG